MNVPLRILYAGVVLVCAAALPTKAWHADDAVLDDTVIAGAVDGGATKPVWISGSGSHGREPECGINMWVEKDKFDEHQYKVGLQAISNFDSRDDKPHPSCGAKGEIKLILNGETLYRGDLNAVSGAVPGGSAVNFTKIDLSKTPDKAAKEFKARVSWTIGPRVIYDYDKKAWVVAR